MQGSSKAGEKAGSCRLKDKEISWIFYDFAVVAAMGESAAIGTSLTHVYNPWKREARP
jgi:hypothetical protein